MMKKFYFLFAIASFTIITSCNPQQDIDDELPIIDGTYLESYPTNCDTLHRGQTNTIVIKCSDNVALSAYNIDIHNNFDNHSHSTELELTECAQFEPKTPVNPFLYIKSDDIPQDLQSYIIRKEVLIPGDVDTGSYHISIRITDKNGWSSMKGYSVVILDK